MSVKGAILGTVGAVGGFFIGGPAGAIALGSAGYGAGAALDGADKSVDAAIRNQQLADQQANEIANRASDNTKAIMSDAEVQKGSAESGLVRGGVDVSSASALVALENIHANAQRDAYLQERDANLQGAAIKARAQNEADAARAGRTATQIGAVTSILGAGASVYANSFKSPGSTAAATPKAPSNYGAAGGSYTDTGSIA